MPRKKVEHPHVMTVETINGTIVQSYPERRTGAVVRGGERIAAAMGFKSKDTLYNRMDEAGRVWVNSTWYALGYDARAGGLITWTNSADNWRTSATIQQELEAERKRKIREGAAQQAAVAPRERGKFKKSG